jgi:phage terminase small subunit
VTPKQAAFVREYLIDLNATRAAIRAGYSPRTARAIGHENLTKVVIREAVEAAHAARATRTEVTADMVLAALLREATAGGSHLVRVRALELLGRHLGMFPRRRRRPRKTGLRR